MKINIYGLLIVIIYSFYVAIIRFNRLKRRVLYKGNKQLQIIDFICNCGLYFFSIFSIFDYGYQFNNKTLDIVWLILFIIINVLIIFTIIRYYMYRKNEVYLFKPLLVKYPLTIYTRLLFVISGSLLLNPYIIFFSLGYIINGIVIDHNRQKEVF